MGFFDLNIPYHESDRHVTDKSSLKGRRLKLALRAMELGYTGVAYNRTLRGVMSESDRCSTTLFPLSKFATSSSSSSFVSAVKFHREILNVATSSAFRQYTRLTVIVETPAQASALNSGNPILRSYDIVSVRPVNQNAFDQACQTSEVDMIAIDFSDKLPFRLKQPMIKAAIKRGVYFEITYSGLIADAQSRRQIVSNCKLLANWTRGQNLIICSAASSATEFRGPQDVANLCSLLGLSMEHAKAAISKNCRSLLGNALRKKHFYKEAVKVEKISSGGQVKLAQSAFDDWLQWDPISSGEGDLLLDEIEKSFATSNAVKETGKAIDFTSNLNGLPAHGLRIKDLTGLTNAALKPAHSDNSVCAAMEIEDTAALEKPEEQAGLNALHEPHSNYTATSKEQGHVTLPECPVSSPGAPAPDIHLDSTCKDFRLSLNDVSEEQSLLPLGKGGDQTPPSDANLGYEPSARAESAISPLSPCNGTGTNAEEILSASINKLNHSKDFEAKLVASETDLQDSLSLLCEGSDLNGGGQVHITEVITPAADNQAFVELSDPFNRSVTSALQSEQISLENQCDGGVCTQEGVIEDKVANSNGCECEALPLALDASQDASMMQEQREMTNGSVKLSDGVPTEGILNLGTDYKKPYTCHVMGDQDQINSVPHYQGRGRERRKQNSPHRPFLFPFKRFLSPRPFKRKSWKLKHK